MKEPGDVVDQKLDHLFGRLGNHRFPWLRIRNPPLLQINTDYRQPYILTAAFAEKEARHRQADR